jgi:hypothetical protein
LPSGRKQASGIDSNKAWIWNEAGESVGYLAVPDKNKNTPPHTSRRQITPRKRGFFSSVVRPAPKKMSPTDPPRIGGAHDLPRPLRGLPAPDQVIGMFTVNVKVAACITEPDVAVTVTVDTTGAVEVVGLPMFVWVAGELRARAKKSRPGTGGFSRSRAYGSRNFNRTSNRRSSGTSCNRPS